MLVSEHKESFASDFAVRVLHVFFLADFAIGIVVRLENERRLGAHLADALDEHVVIFAECFVVKNFNIGVVNADGENHEVRLVIRHFLFKERARFFKVVRNLRTVDADIRVRDAGGIVLCQNACERKVRAGRYCICSGRI